MPAVVNFLGTRINDVESATNWTSYKFGGGGGGNSNTDYPADGFVQGTSALAWSYTAADRAFVACYDYVAGGGTALDFSPGGSEKNQLVYVWANGLFPLNSTGVAVGGFYGGLGIALSDDATLSNSWAAWSIYGLETYPGGWQKLVIDPTKAPTASGGTFSVSSLLQIRQFGIAYCFTAGKSGPQAVWVDAIDVGSGLRIYGTGTTEAAFNDLLDEDEGTTNNRYGVFKSLETTDTVLETQGKIFIGDETGVNSTDLSDIDKIIVMAAPQYQNSAGGFENAIPDDYLEVKIEGNTTGSTNIRFGIKVDGATTDEDTGRNGVLFLGNSDYNCDFKFNDGNVDSLDMYGCTIRSFQPTGGLVWNAASNHDFVGSFLDNSAKLTPDSGVRIRNSTFLNHPSGIGPTGEADAAVLFETSPPDTEISDIVNSSFVSNFYAVEHAESGEYTYDGLSFSANDYDVYYSYTGVGDLIINATNGSNPATAETGNPSNTVTFVNAVTLTLEDVVANSEVRFYTSGTKTERYGVENSPDDGDGFGNVDFSYQFGDPGVDIRIFHLDYQPLNLFARTLGSTNASIPIQQIPDRNYENP